MTNAVVQKPFTDIAIRDANLHKGSTADGITRVRNQKSVLVVFTSTLDQAITVGINGTIFNDKLHTSPSTDVTAAMAAGNVTKQVASLETTTPWQYVDPIAQAAIGPGAGTLTIDLLAPKERR